MLLCEQELDAPCGEQTGGIVLVFECSRDDFLLYRRGPVPNLE